MALRVITPPVCEPITVAQAKLHARVTDTSEDALWPILIAAARSHGESLTRRAFVLRTMELTLDGFPGIDGSVELPMPPLGEVLSVKYEVLDSDTGLVVERTLDPDAYVAEQASDSVPAEMTPVVLWPTTRPGKRSVRIRYTAGWPVSGTGAEGDPYVPTTPEGIIAWLLVRVTGLYEQRENFVLGTSGNAVVPMGRTFIDALLDPYTILEVV